MKIFTNKYCEISKNENGYIIHSLRGTYPDKHVPTLMATAIATQIQLATLKLAEQTAEAIPTITERDKEQHARTQELKAAIKEAHKQTATQPYPMIEGEGAPQYTFALPAEPVQLALL